MSPRALTLVYVTHSGTVVSKALKAVCTMQTRRVQIVMGMPLQTKNLPNFTIFMIYGKVYLYVAVWSDTTRGCSFFEMVQSKLFGPFENPRI
jgi:hypothetical protein